MIIFIFKYLYRFNSPYKGFASVGKSLDGLMNTFTGSIPYKPVITPHIGVNAIKPFRKYRLILVEYCIRIFRELLQRATVVTVPVNSQKMIVYNVTNNQGIMPDDRIEYFSGLFYQGVLIGVSINGSMQCNPPGDSGRKCFGFLYPDRISNHVS